MAENTYKKTFWEDDIFDPVTQEIISEGTPVLAKYLNNIENGVFNAHEFVADLATAIKRLQVYQDLDGRAPDANGSFADALDGGKSPILSVGAVSTTLIEAGTTTVVVEDVMGLEALTEVTIYDEVNREDVLITAIDGNTLTVQALVNNYAKGAKVARSTVAIDTTNKEMETGAHVTYTVELMEVA